ERVVVALDRLAIPYMVTGSVVSSIQGVPRSTHDIDLVVTLAPDQVDPLLESFTAPDFYLSRDAMQDALRHRSMFNLLSISDGEKVDFWLLKDEPFDRSCFSRRRVEDVFGLRLFVSAPEDTILAKLRWAQMYGNGTKQVKDAMHVYEIQKSTLDLA